MTLLRVPVRTGGLHQAACVRLQSCPHRDVRELRVKVRDDGRIRIRGTVLSFYHKQLAQELLRGLAAAHNHIIINEAATRTSAFLSTDATVFRWSAAPLAGLIPRRFSG